MRSLLLWLAIGLIAGSAVLVAINSMFVVAEKIGPM